MDVREIGRTDLLGQPARDSTCLPCRDRRTSDEGAAPVGARRAAGIMPDRARQGLDRTALVNFTRACLAEFCSDDTPNGLLAQAEMMKAMRQHAFVNDAHGERDFGQMTFRDMPVWFKIDYYDLDLEYGSKDPSDASITRRVITIMLPSDY